MYVLSLILVTPMGGDNRVELIFLNKIEINS